MSKIGLGTKTKRFVNFLLYSIIRSFHSSPDLILQHLMVQYPAPKCNVSYDLSQVT